MPKKLCLVHANCQGEPLVRLLRLCPEFERRYEVRLYTNYIREPVPEADLARADLFLYQRLEAPWGDLASDVLLSKVRPSCRTLCAPNMFFLGYWPLWSGAPGFDYRDVFLDRLLDMGLPPRDILRTYLRGDLAAKFDLQGLADASLAREREKEAATPVKYVDAVLRGFRSRRLFHTVNHPGRELTFLAAEGVLRLLDLPSLGAAVFEALPEPYPDCELPIHPQVAAFFGLRFAGPETRYQVYGRSLTFAQYAAEYVACRLEGVADFIGYLAARAGA